MAAAAVTVAGAGRGIAARHGIAGARPEPAAAAEAAARARTGQREGRQDQHRHEREDAQEPLGTTRLFHGVSGSLSPKPGAGYSRRYSLKRASALGPRIRTPRRLTLPTPGGATADRQMRIVFSVRRTGASSASSSATSMASAAQHQLRLHSAPLRQLLEVAADLGQRLDQALEVVARQEQDRRAARRAHAGRGRLVVDQRHLAEHLARAQARQRHLDLGRAVGGAAAAW